MSKIRNLVIICSLIVATVVANSEIGKGNEEYSLRLFENKITSMVECLRSKIEAGIPALRIPTLDPLQIRIPIPLLFRKEMLRGNLILRKFRLEGLAGFKQTDGSVSITNTLKLGLKFEKIKLTSKYNAKLLLFGLMDIYGKGDLSVKLSNFHIYATVKVKTIPRPEIGDVFLNVTLPSTQAVITGLLGDEFMSDIISRQLSDTLTTLAVEEHQRFNDILHHAATSLIDNKINPALSELSLPELVEILKALSGNCEQTLASILQIVTTSIIDLSGVDSDAIYSGNDNLFEDDSLL